MSRMLGLRGPDKPDARDRLFSAHRAAAAPIPTKASVDDPTVEPKDQLSTSSCVGNSCSQALRLAYIRHGVACPELSALFVYRIARNIDGTDTDDGSYLRSGVQAIQKMGAAPELSWPFSEKAINNQPTFQVEHDAFDKNGTRSYHRIAAGNTDDVKRALASGLSVVGGWDVDEAFVSGDGKSVIGAQDRAHLAGGHAIAIVGYDGDTFTFCNSWGSSYGFNGRFHASKAFVAAGTDLWALDVSGGVL